jgi:serine/threonine-protein kinase
MSAEQAIRICEACDRFEWDWLRGSTPRIAHYLGDAPADDRLQLLEDLLRIDLEWRRASGDRPTSEDYTRHFPEEAERIRRIFRESEDDEDEQPARIIGRYELIEEIGRGREGVVYRAREMGIASREVAIKLLSAGVTSSRDAAQRFVKEIRSLAEFHHAHIVPYHDSGDDRGQLYYVTRLMRGGTLAERPGPMDPTHAARLLIQIAGAVNYLHSQPRPIVHRDLKPGNILLDEAGKPHVADFGLAVLLDGEGVADGACGTPGYIAPEQFDRRFGEVGPACDVYSLGVISYELLTGQMPFPRTEEWILQTLEGEPVRPSRLRPDIPPALERICLKCLRKSTRDRYTTSELFQDLQAFERQEPLPNNPPEGVWERLVDRARREPALAVRLALIAACSAIMWGYWVISGGFAGLRPSHWAWLVQRLVERSGVFGGSIPIDAILVGMNQAILIAWDLASWAFQRRLNRRRDQGGLEFGWRLADVAATTLVIEFDDALMSPLIVIYAVLIVASALWARADEIRQTTLLSMAGYVLLVLSFRRFHPPEEVRLWRHFEYLACLTAIGLMLTYQANRTRALARICGDRD